MNTKTFITSVSAAIGLAMLSLPVQAEVINNTHWMVKSGDTVYSIARHMYPGDTKQQVRFRRELVKANPEIFSGKTRIMNVGDKLRLPRFVIAKANTQKSKAQPQRAVAKQKVATPDPVDVIGKVIIAQGDLKATNRSSTRRLSRHSNVMSGDTLKTASNSRAQIRLKDGALISLQPNSEFKIAEFNFNGAEDGTERGVFELLKGGFRTITGLIGHKNKQNYKVRTTVATIGIRGTHYGLMLCEASSCSADNLADGLYGGVIDGSVAIDNNSGQQLFNNDQYFHVASSDTTAIETLTPPPVFEGSLAQTGTSGDTQLADSQTTTQTPSSLFESAAVNPDQMLNTVDGTSIQSPDQGLTFVYASNLTPETYIRSLQNTATTTTYVCDLCGSVTDNSGVALTQTIFVDMNFLSQTMTKYDVIVNDGTASTLISADNAVDFSADLNALSQFTVSEFGTAGQWNCGGATAACTGTASVAFINPDASALATEYTVSSADGSKIISGNGEVLAGTAP
ncbi:MAG: FecR family protein [Gammaproteobacteria bacterium]|nr:FecR family protein [Gammaproteobacteria bacterium]